MHTKFYPIRRNSSQLQWFLPNAHAGVSDHRLLLCVLRHFHGDGKRFVLKYTTN